MGVATGWSMFLTTRSIPGRATCERLKPQPMRSVSIPLLSALGCTLFFIASACDVPSAEGRAGVRVHVTAVDGQHVEPEQIEFVRFRQLSQDPEADFGDLSGAATSDAMCLDADCQQWLVRPGEAGVFDIEASYCGRLKTSLVRIEPALDGSIEHQDVTFAFNPALCSGRDTRVASQKTRAQDTDNPHPGELAADEHCDQSVHPSVYVYTAQQFGDYLQHEPVERLWLRYIEDGEYVVEPGYCMRPTLNGCAAWAAGWEQPGRIEVMTEWCATEVRKPVFVPMTDDGCHVETQYTTLLLESTGCLAVDSDTQQSGDDFDMFP